MNDICNLEVLRSYALSESLTQLEADPEFVDLSGLYGIEIDLRYASTNNFMGVDLYGVFNRAFLHRRAARQLRLACRTIVHARPGHKLLVLDATRPRSVQYRLWAHVKGTSQECYVADPDIGSIHSFGFAVDVTIVDEHGVELDMGTAFDAFDELSQPALEEQHVQSGRLSAVHMENRLLLRHAMESAGFIQHPLEWWHFDAVAQDVARRYSQVE